MYNLTNRPSDERILIVDDNPMNVGIISKILCNDFLLETAADGEEALAKADAFRPQLILLDVMMPGLDGYDVCRRIKTRSDDHFVQVMLVSGRGSTAERLAGYAALADDYIVKPFDHLELRSKVHVQFRLWRMQQELKQSKKQLQITARQLEDLVAVRTAQLTATQDMAVFSLAQLADSRDPETGEHLYRMRAYSQILARQLARRGPYREAINAEFLDHLYRASPLHDIGKVGVSDAILLKPGRLTAEEFEVMKQHVVIGAETLERARDYMGDEAGFLAMAADVARYHHERFNGSGYCAGLCGEQIPLAARIVALADVFDALTSKRVYKPAYSYESAEQIILDERGAHFDPAVVDAFVDCRKQFREVQTGRISPALAANPAPLPAVVEAFAALECTHAASAAW